MKILFMIGALLSAVLLTLPPFLYQCISRADDAPYASAGHASATVRTEAVVGGTVRAFAEQEASPQTEQVTALMSDTETAVLCAAPPADVQTEAVTVITDETTAAVQVQTEDEITVAPTFVSDPSAGYDSRTYITVSGETRSYTVSLREYLIGVVMAEMPSYFHEEALRAQAVAARSYLLYRLDRGYAIYDWGSSCTAHFSEEEGVDFFGDAYPSVKEKITAAVDDTDGVVLYYDGRVCCAAYHAMSYSCTEEAALVWGGDTPYLTSVPTPESAFLSGMTTEAAFDEASLCRLLGVEDALPLAMTYTEAGRVAEVTAASGEVITGESFRSLLRLRSTAVTVTSQNEDHLQLCVRGYGHGVGMSQYGADLYADAGWSYAAILTHYYPAAELGLAP